MKHFKFLLTAVLMMVAVNFTFAQSTEWKEKKNFREVMSKTFHPAEEGNLQPIKKRSAELVAKAEAWKNSEIPASIKDKKATKKSLKKLVKEAKKLNESLKNGATDEQIKTQLYNLHDTFHTIVGLCNAKDDHEHQK